MALFSVGSYVYMATKGVWLMPELVPYMDWVDLHGGTFGAAAA